MNYTPYLVRRNPDFIPETPRPIAYFTVQIKDLLYSAAPNMTDEQKTMFNQLEKSIIDSSQFAGESLETMEKQIVEETRVKMDAAKAEVLDFFGEARATECEATLCQDQYEKLEAEIQETKGKLIVGKGHISNFEEAHVQIFGNRAKLEVELMHANSIRRMEERIEMENLEKELDLLKIDLAMKRKDDGV